MTGGETDRRIKSGHDCNERGPMTVRVAVILTEVVLSEAQDDAKDLAPDPIVQRVISATR
jgi:hypothetical protein